MLTQVFLWMPVDCGVKSDIFFTNIKLRLLLKYYGDMDFPDIVVIIIISTIIIRNESRMVIPAVNSLRPSDAIWRQWSWTTLAQVMACCLTAPSHYLNQCWLITRGVLWHTSESSFAGIAQGIDSGYEFEKDILKNIFKSPRGQWVNAAIVSWIHHVSATWNRGPT